MAQSPLFTKHLSTVTLIQALFETLHTLLTAPKHCYYSQFTNQLGHRESKFPEIEGHRANGSPQSAQAVWPGVQALYHHAELWHTVILPQGRVWLNCADAHKMSYNNKHTATVSVWGLELLCWGKATCLLGPRCHRAFSNSSSNCPCPHTWTSALVFPFDISVSNGTVTQAWPPVHLAGLQTVFVPGIRCAWSQVWCSRFSYTSLSLVDLPLHVLEQVYIIPGVTT